MLARASMPGWRSRASLRPMQVEANGTQLWFDVEGAALVPDGATMRRATHGPADPWRAGELRPLVLQAALLPADRRRAGGLPGPPRPRPIGPPRSSRSGRTSSARMTSAPSATPSGSSARSCSGHSMGSWIVLMYGARHPGHAGALISQNGMARFDLDRLAEGFRRAGGDEVADVARRAFAGEDVSDEAWAPAFAAYGPNVPSPDELSRRTQNLDVDVSGELMRELDMLDQLPLDHEPDAGLRRRAGRRHARSRRHRRSTTTCRPRSAA